MASYGHTFTSGDTVTPTKLNAARTVSDIVNADISATADIAGSKLADGTVTSAKIADGTIVNADINASAAIAGTKIAPNFGSQNVTTTGTATFREVNASGVGPVLQLTETDASTDNKRWDVYVDNETMSVRAVDDAYVNARNAIEIQRTGFSIDSVSVPFGNVGIGKTPSTKLDVNGTIQAPNLNVLNPSGTASIEVGGTGDVFIDLKRPDSDDYDLRLATDSTISLIHTASNQDLAIQALGGRNVGIGTLSPTQKLTVDGTAAIGGATPVYITSGWRGLGTGSTSEISNDTAQYKSLMLVGNSSAGGARQVSLWDDATVNGGLTVTGTATAAAFSGPLTGNVTGNVTGNLTGTASAIADGSVSTAKIVDGAVTDAKIASGVDASKLTTGTLPIARIADAAVTPAKLSQPYTLATAQNSTSGTSIDFTGIPSWAKRITVMLNGVSTNGTSHLQVQLGDSGGFETTGYVSVSGGVGVASGFLIASASAANAWHGALIISLIGSNAYTAFGCVANSAAATSNTSAGSKTLSDTLTQIRITTVNGTDTFDAGTINIAYEG